jgi:hypothetical protein
MKVTVINEGREPIMLEDGTQVGAAYTPEARRTVELSENDRAQYVRPGRLVIVEDAPAPKTMAVPAVAPEGDNKTERRGK